MMLIELSISHSVIGTYLHSSFPLTNPVLFQSDTMQIPMLIVGFMISSLGQHVYCVVPVSTTTCTSFIYISVPSL